MLSLVKTGFCDVISDSWNSFTFLFCICLLHYGIYYRASLVAQRLKRLPPMQETQVQSLGREDPPEKGMANHSSILPRRIPWTEAPGRPHSTGSQRVRHDWATDTTTLEPEPSISLQRISSLRDPPALYLQLWSQAWELPLEQPWQV